MNFKACNHILVVDFVMKSFLTNDSFDIKLFLTVKSKLARHLYEEMKASEVNIVGLPIVLVQGMTLV